MTVKGAELEHVGVAVKSIAETRRLYEEALGLTLGGEEVLAEQGLKLVFFDAGGVKIELLEGLGEDPISRFIEKRGPGIHHLCFKVDDVEAAAASLKTDGYEFITEAPYEGGYGSRVIFMKPSSTFGVLIELIQEG
ncbi:MAG: methylmalonyl-CoA epimerase [candidate division Zixibacteria bacterium]|nr:methylmalonyl-CoA epimerase [candidate division Zixibacteria bacterium]